MRSREAPSSALGLTHRTVKCVLAAVLIPGGCFMGTTIETPDFLLALFEEGSSVTNAPESLSVRFSY
jgi:hypothetical protein